MKKEGPSAKPPSLSLKQFATLPMPPPVEDKKYIILLIHNVSDGVGDFVHGQEFGKLIKEFTQQYG